MPQYTEKLTYPITPDYVKGWTVERALSELVANAIDEDPNFTFKWADGVLTIEDSAHGVPMEGLVLGISNKSDKQIGQFGEGLQIASIVLARSRQVKDIIVESIGYGFVPVITKDNPVRLKNSNSNPIPLLQYNFFDCERTQGTKITLKCSEKLAEKVKQRFLHFDKDYRPPQPPGRMITDHKGKIYISGVLVQENSKLNFSYDLAAQSAKHLQNRDRTQISGWELDRMIRQVIEQTEDAQIFSEWVRLAFANKLSRSEDHINFSAWHRRQLNELREQHLPEGNCVFSEDADQEVLLQLRDKSYNIISCEGDNAMTQQNLYRVMGVENAYSVMNKFASGEKKEKTVWVKEKQLTEQQLNNLQKSVRVVRGLWGEQAVDKYGAYSKLVVDGEVDSFAAGFYSPSTGKIGIKVSTLDDFQTTLSVMIHEAAHRLRHADNSYDYEDRTRGFESQLEKMALQATLRLLEHDLIPESEATIKAQTMQLMQSQMQALQIGSMKKLSQLSGVHYAKMSKLISRPEKNDRAVLADVKAVCDVLQLPAEAIFCLFYSEEIVSEYQPFYQAWNDSIIQRRVSGLPRNKNGRLNSRHRQPFLESVDALQLRGGRYAKVASQIRSHADKEPDEDWLKPYQQLLQLVKSEISS